MNRIFLAIATTVLFTAAGCIKKPEPTPTPTPTPNTNEVHFNFENHFGSDELELNTATYTTAQGEQITISAFNYWITNIRFIKADGTEYTELESYRVLREDKHASLHFHVENVPSGTYTGLKFIIGVDVPRNTSGAQTGELDPAINGDMYWTWSTGYIQAKLEGTSPQSTAGDNSFEYHIAGVQPDYETPQEITLTFPNDMVVGNQAGSIKIKTDVAKWFPTPMKIADMPSVTFAGEMARKISEGYVDMFSITSVGNE